MKWSLTIAFWLCLFVFSPMLLPAQPPCEALPLPRERVVLHLDRNVCLAGETIWFKAWCFLDGGIAREMSKVLYVEIFDETQRAIVRQKFLLQDNQAVGSISIPEDIPSKYYFLKAYTRYMRNFSSSDFHYQQITIANPAIKGGTIPAIAADDIPKQINASAQQVGRIPPVERLRIKLDKGKYLPRETLNFHVEPSRPLAAILSVTVRQKGLGNQPTQEVMQQNEWLAASCQEDPFCRQFYFAERQKNGTPETQVPQKSLLSSVDGLEWLPETRGLTISGLVQNQDKENIAGALTTVAVLQKKPMLYMGITDDRGGFTICLQNMQQQKDLFIGTSNEAHQVLIRNDFDVSYPEISTIPLRFDTVLHRLLSSLHLHQQLDQIYPKNETKPVFPLNPLNRPSTNILAPDRRTELSDFVQLTTMSELFREATPGVALQTRAGKESISVLNFEKQIWYDSPLILLDNVPVFNIAELLKIDPAKVEAVEIHHSDYILGDYVIGGIISVISKTENFADYKWGEQVAFTKFKGFAVPQLFEQVSRLVKSHHPNFQPVLYWQPNLQLRQDKGSTPISIIAPDQPGIYEVLVQGFTEQGEACLGHMTFEVRR